MSPRYSSPAGWLPLPLLAGISLIAAACGAESPAAEEPSGQELLRRPPDWVLEERGHLVPSEEHQWGAAGLLGWSPRTYEREGTPFLWTRTHDVRLVVPALEPTDRELELLMWSPPEADKGPETVAVWLNNVELGRYELSREPERYAIPAPAVTWRQGENQLELRLDTERWAQGGVWHGLALAEVRFGENLQPHIDVDQGLFELVDRTGVRYSVEQVAPSRLLLRGAASGPGTALVHFGAQDPETGSSRIDRDSPVRVAAVDGRVEASLPLPIPSATEVLEVEVVWEAGAAGATLALESLRVEERQPVKRPPIVFVSVDTLAARNMSLYGYPRRTTPEIERFAKRAVTFDTCRSNASWTLPSFMSLMTGLFAYSHKREGERATGQRTEVWENWNLSSNRWTLAEALRAAGYRTAGFVDNLWITERARFTQGFDVYDTEAGAIPKEDPTGGIRHVVPKALDWLDGLDDDEPFFLFVHCFDVHGPYLPTEPWRGAFREDALFDAEARAPAGALVNSFKGIPEYVARGEVPEGELPPELPTSPIAAAYDEGVSEVDAQLGLFFDALAERGILEDAIVVLTADHGESMTDHQYYFGHGLLYEDILRVPLVIHLPGDARAGTRVEESVQLVDLYPTLLDLVGLPHERPYLHGRSLRPALETGEIAPFGTYSEGGIMLQTCIEKDGWKLIESWPSIQTRPATLLTNPLLPQEWIEENAPEVLEMGGMVTADVLARLKEEHGRDYITELQNLLNVVNYELYYLPDDPREEHDLSDQQPERVQRMIGLLRAAQTRREQARMNADTEFDQITFSEEELAELVRLGYADAEEEPAQEPGAAQNEGGAQE